MSHVFDSRVYSSGHTTAFLFFSMFFFYRVEPDSMEAEFVRCLFDGLCANFAGVPACLCTFRLACVDGSMGTCMSMPLYQLKGPIYIYIYMYIYYNVHDIIQYKHKTTEHTGKSTTKMQTKNTNTTKTSTNDEGQTTN